MKQKLKKEITDLINRNGSEPRRGICIAFEKELGKYEFDGKIVNEAELQELAAGCEKLIKMVHYKK